MPKIRIFVSQHLLVAITVSFIAGIYFGPLLETTSALKNDKDSLLHIVTALFLIIAINYYLRRETLLLLPFLAFAVGAYHIIACSGLPSPAHHIYNRIHSKTDCLITGVLTETPKRFIHTSSAIINSNYMQKNSSEPLSAVTGKIKITLKGSWPETIQPGDQIVLRGTFNRPASFNSPGSFDYSRFLAQQDIWITGFIKSPLFIEEIKQKENIAHTISYLPERIRNAISIGLRQKTSPEIYGLYQAILIGDRSAVSQTHLESFKASGVFHILAISGLHLSVIGALLYLALYKVLSISERLLLAFSVRKTALLLTVPPLIIYALLAGMNSPVLRALLMSIITVLAVCNNRIKTFLPLISGAAFVILLYNPHQLRTTSFQLSFCAVTGILLFLPKLVSMFEKQSEQEKNYTTKIYTYLFSAIAVSVVATLSVLPINLVAFNRISVIGPISNLLVEPLICLWALPLGLLSLPLVFLDYSLAEQLLQLGGIGIKAALHVTTFFSELPFSSVWLPTPPLWLVAIYYGALLCLLTIQNVTVSHKRIAILLILLFWVLTKYQHKIIRPTQNQITFLDVGQGSSTIIETRQGNIYIVDGGGSSFSATTIGERVIGPYLWDKGVDQIDTIFITHPDNDHFNGVPFLYEHFHPAQIVIRNQFEPKESYRHFLNNSVTQATRVTVGQTGDIIHSQDYSFTIDLVKNFSQNSHGDSHTNRSEINRGLVLKTCFQQRCLILPGDIDKTAEQELLANKTIGQSTFLLAAHHGSNTSNSREFIEQIAPESIFISAGKNSRYFPGKELLELGKKAKIPLYNTGNLGTLELEFDDEGVGLYRYRKFENNPLHERKRDLLHYYPFKAQQVSERTSTPQ